MQQRILLKRPGLWVRREGPRVVLFEQGFFLKRLTITLAAYVGLQGWCGDETERVRLYSRALYFVLIADPTKMGHDHNALKRATL